MSAPQGPSAGRHLGTIVTGIVGVLALLGCLAAFVFIDDDLGFDSRGLDLSGGSSDAGRDSGGARPGTSAVEGAPSAVPYEDPPGDTTEQTEGDSTGSADFPVPPSAAPAQRDSACGSATTKAWTVTWDTQQAKAYYDDEFARLGWTWKATESGGRFTGSVYDDANDYVGLLYIRPYSKYDTCGPDRAGLSLIEASLIS